MFTVYFSNIECAALPPPCNAWKNCVGRGFDCRRSVHLLTLLISVNRLRLPRSPHKRTVPQGMSGGLASASTSSSLETGVSTSSVDSALHLIRVRAILTEALHMRNRAVSPVTYAVGITI
jgi:hypothetical protein